MNINKSKIIKDRDSISILFMINDLIFCKPEDEGLNSERISKFIERLKERKTNLHSSLIGIEGLNIRKSRKEDMLLMKTCMFLAILKCQFAKENQ